MITSWWVSYWKCLIFHSYCKYPKATMIYGNTHWTTPWQLHGLNQQACTPANVGWLKASRCVLQRNPAPAPKKKEHCVSGNIEFKTYNSHKNHCRPELMSYTKQCILVLMPWLDHVEICRNDTSIGVCFINKPSQRWLIGFGRIVTKDSSVKKV